MLTAKDAILPLSCHTHIPERKVDASMPLLQVLPLLLDAPMHSLSVEESGNLTGVITESSLLGALGAQIAPRDDSSIIEISCLPTDFSASAIANAVEQADTHLTDLLSRPGREGNLLVTLRVRTLNTEAVAASLERYGFHVISSSGIPGLEAQMMAERLASLRTLLNI